MSKRVLLLSALGVVLVAAASSVYLISPAFAQDPQPPPKEDPTAACCRVLATSGRTIGGPGKVEHAISDIDPVFVTDKKMLFCATVENSGGFVINFRICEGEFGISERFFICSPVVDETHVNPGETRTLCGEATIAQILGGRGSSYRWRVDKAED